MDVTSFLALKYGDLARGGWAPRLRARFGHLTPDDRYEMLVSGFVNASTDWLDVGCGRFLFGPNTALARLLAERCASLTGIDPSANILENELLDRKEQCFLEEFQPGLHYDLVTMRMVVEHMVDPVAAAAALAALVKPGGHVIIYTVNKWSPVSVLSAMTPLSVHLRAKRLLWGGEDRDTFPTVYKMNTRRSLQALLSHAGFAETRFDYVSDTRTLARFKLTNAMELGIWRALHALSITYPENCLIGVYRRLPP